jgi:hypothetical protein
MKEAEMADYPDKTTDRYVRESTHRVEAPRDGAGSLWLIFGGIVVALVLAFAIGVLELLLPESLRDEAAIVMVAVFVVAPLGRVVWLMVRWIRRGDWRFAAVGAVLLAVFAVGFLVR